MRVVTLLLAALVAWPAVAAPGSLVIVGGALSADNAAVHQAFLERRLADAPTIAVIPAASGEPAGSARRLAAALARHGADPADVVLVHVASVDDPETPDVDESLWASNASNPEEIEKITKAGAIWFAGGDQSRIRAALVQKDGADSPMLAAIRSRLQAGAVIGGTSAGAAIMSRRMILNGTSRGALTRPVRTTLHADESDTALVLGEGLGFLPRGLVDQHFTQRDRLGRLTRALFELDTPVRLGFGIDEDTALVVDLADNRAQVLGSGMVTLVDARKATRTSGRKPFSADAVAIARLRTGDALDLSTLTGQGIAFAIGPFPLQESHP